MDLKLPALLEKHINSLLEEFSVNNWDIKCGQKCTLTIHWEHKTNSLSDNNIITSSRSIYKKKPPSQIRRDQRRNRDWRNRSPPSPDSGYIKSPINDMVIDCKSPISTGEEGHIDSFRINSQGENSNTSIVSHEQPPVTSEINFNNNPQEQVVVISPPREDTLHLGNEIEMYTPEETLDEIPELACYSTKLTSVGPTTVQYDNVLVKNNKSHPVHLNVKGIYNSIVVKSSYCCKKCDVELKLLRNDCLSKRNLCRDCCKLSDPNCSFCPYLK